MANESKGNAMNAADKFLAVGIVDEDKWECAVCLSIHGDDSESAKSIQCDSDGAYAICDKCREMGKGRAVMEKSGKRNA